MYIAQPRTGARIRIQQALLFVFASVAESALAFLRHVRPQRAQEPREETDQCTPFCDILDRISAG